MGKPRIPGSLVLMLAFGWGILAFFQRNGDVLLGTDRIWGQTDDAAIHHLAWLYYVREGWHFPLGLIRDYPRGIGMSIGFADTIPWVAIILKLFKSLLPDPFQYLGLWVCLCFGLQALMGAVIARITKMRLLGGATLVLLLAAATPLVHRVHHAALCAHWLILALLALHLQPWPTRAQARRALAAGLLLFLFACGVHVYLAAMVLVLLVALLIRLWLLDRVVGHADAGVLLVAAAVGASICFYVIGFFDGSGLTFNDFGDFSTDALTFFNPHYPLTSALLPALPTAPGQHEGLAYLGAGAMLLLLAALVSLAARRTEARALPWRRVAPLLLCCFAMGIFSLSNRVTFAGKTVVTLPVFLYPGGNVFHASGRFIWPLYYVVLLGSALLFDRLWRPWPRLQIALLVPVLLLQMRDLKQMGVKPDRYPMVMFRSPGWDCARGRYRHLVMYPPQLAGCSPKYPWLYYLPIGFLAHRLDMTINSGIAARFDAADERRYCAQLDDQVRDGRLSADALYVVHSDEVSRFSTVPCTRLEGLWVCRGQPSTDCPLTGE